MQTENTDRERRLGTQVGLENRSSQPGRPIGRADQRGRSARPIIEAIQGSHLGRQRHVQLDEASGADAPPESAISASEQRRPSRHASLDYWHFPRTNSVVEMAPLLHRPSVPINRRGSPALNGAGPYR